jgi:hypothetical protein
LTGACLCNGRSCRPTDRRMLDREHEVLSAAEEEQLRRVEGLRAERGRLEGELGAAEEQLRRARRVCQRAPPN